MFAGVKLRIEEANEEFLRRMTSGDPVLVDVAPARDVHPDFPERAILHAGPPVDWRHMSGAQREGVYRRRPLRRLGRRPGGSGPAP